MRPFRQSSLRFESCNIGDPSGLQFWTASSPSSDASDRLEASKATQILRDWKASDLGLGEKLLLAVIFELELTAVHCDLDFLQTLEVSKSLAVVAAFREIDTGGEVPEERHIGEVLADVLVVVVVGVVFL